MTGNTANDVQVSNDSGTGPQGTETTSSGSNVFPHPAHSAATNAGATASQSNDPDSGKPVASIQDKVRNQINEIKSSAVQQRPAMERSIRKQIDSMIEKRIHAQGIAAVARETQELTYSQTKTRLEEQKADIERQLASLAIDNTQKVQQINKEEKQEVDAANLAISQCEAFIAEGAKNVETTQSQ